MTEPAPCIFCRIASGDDQANVVLDDDSCVAFLDQRPVFPGHCLLIPRTHVETLTDLPDSLISPLFTNARLLARAVVAAMQADGSFVAINNRVSQSVPHLHIHVIPRRQGDGLRGFFWPRQKYSSAAEAARVAKAIREAVAVLH